MKFPFSLCLYLLLSGALLSPAGSVLAQPPEEQSGAGLSQRQALELVRAQFPGNVISINEVRQGDRVRFRIRIDNEGNIYTVYVDRATGVITRE
jgi:uncharacterized membrane protein YkoI